MKDLKKNSWRFFKITWPVTLIILIVVSFFWKFFFKGLIPIPADLLGISYPWRDYLSINVQNPITSDVVSFSYPMRILAVDLLKSGHLPLWNPYILLGNPLLANFQSAPFSPTNFLYFLFEKNNAWSLQIISQHFLAILFTYFLLRYWRVSKLGALFGGIIFAFSGFNLIWSEWNAHSLTAAFIPLIILFTDRFLKEKKWIYGVGISVSLALQIFSGYPQIVLYTLLAIFLLWIFSRKSVLFFIFLALGLGLSAFQILPGVELLKLSQRVSEPIPVEWVFLHADEVIKFVAPDYFGNHVSKDFWGPKNYTSTIGFVGVSAFVFSFLGLLKWKKSRIIKFLISLVLLSLILSFKNPLSFFLWSKNILGLQAGASYRILVLFNFAMALLAGFGLDNLKTYKSKIRFLILLPAVLIIIGFGIYAISLPDKYALIALESLILPIGILIGIFVTIIFRFKFLIILLTLIELFSFGWKFTPFSSLKSIFPKTPITNYLTSIQKPNRIDTNDVIPINFGMVYDITVPQGYDAIYPERTAKFLGVINSNDIKSSPQDRYGLMGNNVSSKILDLMNVKYTLTTNLKEKNIVFKDRSVGIVENKNSLSRNFFVNDWEIIKDDNKILSNIINPNYPLNKKIILEEEPQGNPKGFIFTSDIWYPGWKAYVDGVETKSYRADYIFRAVPVGSVNSKVVYEYEPASFYNGIKISILSLAMLIIIGRIRRKLK